MSKGTLRTNNRGQQTAIKASSLQNLKKSGNTVWVISVWGKNSGRMTPTTFSMFKRSYTCEQLAALAV